MSNFDLGESIPPHTAHAVSVSLPTWQSNVGYEEGEEWVVSRMTTGYPRFFIHRSIEAFATELASRFAPPGQRAFLFPTRQIASRCLAFVRARSLPEDAEKLDAVHLILDTASPSLAPTPLSTTISAVFCTPAAAVFAKEYWQHTGDGVSSRRAEFYHGLFNDGLLRLDERPQSPVPGLTDSKPCKGPRRYQRPMSLDGAVAPTTAPRSNGHPPEPEAGPDAQETSRFLEERFGRNLDISLVSAAKSAIRRRIAGALTNEIDLTATPLPAMGANSRGVADLREEDVYLYPCGMNAIYNAHRILLAARGPMKSVNFGFSYVDTLKILQKFGPGCVFFGRASEAELDELEQRLKDGERFLALFCEFPGNPLLTSPNLKRIRSLADTYDFAVVVDETIGTFTNVNVVQFSDIVVSSLTKIFSGDCNVMGGSAIINPSSRYYASLKAAANREFEDTYWAEDIIFMERNSRDFASRIDRINNNAEAISDVLAANSLVKKVYYPTHNESRPNYEACKLPKGGYGGLLSVTFHAKKHAVAFYDALESAKGPSLGTNFTLTSPFVLLAHYKELDWAASLGVDPDLIRISAGLEDTTRIVDAVKEALGAAERS